MTEQLVLIVPTSPAERYAAWRATSMGCVFYAEIERRALTASNAGVQRIEVNHLFAELRAEWHVVANNNFRSFMARELVHRHPLELKAKIEIRTPHARKAA